MADIRNIKGLPFFCLLLSLIFSTTCNEEVSAAVKNRKLVKTQGTNEYANTTCGLQDKEGNLWFGTSGEGLYRYDGNYFTQFTTADGLCNNYVYALMQDRSGNIWIGTAYGVCRYDGKKLTSVPITVFNAGSGLAASIPSGTFTINRYGVPDRENAVYSIIQDKKGMLWLGAYAGMYCYDGVSFSSFPGNKNIVNTDTVHLKTVAYMLEDKNGNIWFCSGNMPGNEGICRYDGRSITRYKPGNEGWVHNVIEENDGSLLFATRHRGVLRYDGKNFTSLTKGAGIDEGSVDAVLKDRHGNIWIATELGSGQMGEDGGVWRYDGKDFKRFTTKDGLIHNGVFFIIEDRAGKIWFGTRNTGLCSYDGKKFIRYSE